MALYVPEELYTDKLTAEVSAQLKRFYESLASGVTSLPWTSINFTGSTFTDIVTASASHLNAGTVPLARLSGITNTEIAALAGIVWSKIDKTGSSLADLATRSAGDLTSGTLSASLLPTIPRSYFTVNASAIGAGVTTYLGPPGSDVTETNVHAVIPFAGVLRNLYIVADGFPGVAQTFTYTVRLNAADGAITATISGGAATTANDTTHTIAVAPGDLIDVKLVTSAGAATQRHAIGLEIASA